MTQKKHEPIGHHYIVEASGCDPNIISDVAKVQQILVKAAEIAGANVWAALELSKRLGQGKNVVTILPDRAERYFSTALI